MGSGLGFLDPGFVSLSDCKSIMDITLDLVPLLPACQAVYILGAGLSSRVTVKRAQQQIHPIDQAMSVKDLEKDSHCI